MSLPFETDVLIVGAGPTGLALAATLQQAGIRHVLIDRLTQGHTTSRAAVIHAHTLEVLEQIGVADQLLARGLKLSRFCIRDRDRALLSLPFETLASRHASLLMLPQDVTEEILAARLTALGGTIQRGVEATQVRQSAAGAEVVVQTPAGARTIRARYVVGADGMHSKVREAAGIAFEGAPYAESFVLADIRMDWPLHDREVSLFFSPAGLVVVAPLPGGAFRVVATLENAPERPGHADLQALLDARGPTHRARVTEVIWSSRFRVHHRLAAAYRSDRMFVMGDAAHVHSPAGGQGMNCGLIDACVLGELLSDVICGRRTETELDLYQALRRPAADEVLALAGRLTVLATMRGGFRRMMRNALLRLADRVAPVKRRLVASLSGVSRRQLSRLPAGDAATHARAASPLLRLPQSSDRWSCAPR